jgi:hypothetical protein
MIHLIWSSCGISSSSISQHAQSSTRYCECVEERYIPVRAALAIQSVIDPSFWLSTVSVTQGGRLTTRTYICDVRFSSHESNVDLGSLSFHRLDMSFEVGKDLHVTTIIPARSILCCRLTRMYEFASHIYHLVVVTFNSTKVILTLMQMLTGKAGIQCSL